MTKSFYSNGKLLLTGEYAVLNGALSLAVPTRYGQSLSVQEIDSQKLIWISRDEKGRVWFEGIFDVGLLERTAKKQNVDAPGHLPPQDGQSPPSPEDAPIFTGFERIAAGFDDNARGKSRETSEIRETLINILREAQKLNPNFLNDAKGCAVETKLTFPRDWGLGSSSTLINNIAQWAEVDAFELLWNAFSGSGYDIACAQNDRPIYYRLNDGKPDIAQVDFNPPFQDKLYFIYLNKKQNSREGIASYQEKNFDKTQLIAHISGITKKTVSCKSLPEFESLMAEHETLLSKILEIPPVKELLFPDFKGAIKSLGAWGGDFVLAAGDETTPGYFKELGYGTVLPYSEMVLAPRDKSL